MIFPQNLEMAVASSTCVLTRECSICRQVKDAVPLTLHERTVAGKLFQIVNIPVPVEKGAPFYLCFICLERLHIFKKLLKIILNNSQLDSLMILMEGEKTDDDNNQPLNYSKRTLDNLHQMEENKDTNSNIKTESDEKEIKIEPPISPKEEDTDSTEPKPDDASSSYIEENKSNNNNQQIKGETKPDETIIVKIECENYGETVIKEEVKSDLAGTGSTIKEVEDISPSTSTSRSEMGCRFCGKTFTHRGDLNKHTRTHTQERPFGCTSCGRRFGNASNLARHLRTHSPNRPFVCPRCHKGFTRKDKLRCHRNSRACNRQKWSKH